MMSLFEACQQADVERIKSLIEQQCDLTQIDDQGRTVLHHCNDHTDIACAQLILQDESVRKLILDRHDNEGCSALHLACMNGNMVMVTYLCEQGANVQLVDYESHTLIHWITVCGHLHLFDILMKHGASVHTPDVYGAFPIHYASQLCGKDGSVEGLAILKKLIDSNVDVNCVDEHNRTPFIWAASAGAVDALRLLYKAGANSQHADKDALTALHGVATRGHANCVRILVELYECPLEDEDINGCTALFYAISFQHVDVCRLLLDLKANPNHQDKRGRTPSHCAAAKGNLECLKYLIEHQADIWIRNKRGDFPIHEAINGKDRDKSNESLQKKHLDVIRSICRLYPDKVNIRNGEQRTPLHLAANLGDVNMCAALIACGARINSFIRTKAGNYITPYDLAHIRCEDACAEYLVYNHGGQRGNLLANIFARRIQKFFRQFKRIKFSNANQRRKLFAMSIQTPTNKTNDSPVQPVMISIPLSQSQNHLLNQAKICLDNKEIEDRSGKSNRHSCRRASFLLDCTDEEKKRTRHRRQHLGQSKPTGTLFNRSIDHQLHSTEKIIIHTSNSIGTSVKLYERHKLIAEELYKIKQARIHNHNVVINRPLYKILIENAFNPANRHVEEIERYLESLVKAYETELDAIRKRSKSIPVRRPVND
ncbi:unnamed protein product [Adineta ricciae]|uniref:Uncharacterized protein n=1 Tax=Adineta ricciae TaxID=249248 RepID=A0A814WKM3_ADIRI|nr:unnamed protein product [Adineta ricciae]